MPNFDREKPSFGRAVALAGWGSAGERFERRAAVSDPRLRTGPSDPRDLLVRVAAGGFFASLAASFLLSAFNSARGIDLFSLDLAAVRWLSEPAIGLYYLAVTAFIVIREAPRAKAPGVVPRIVAVLGSYILGLYAFFPRNPSLSPWLHLLSAFLVLGGTLASVWVLTWLGRSFSVMAEARRVVTRGPYRFVRHPLYLTELVSSIGVFIVFASPWTAAVLALQLGLQVQRMKNEERVLAATFPDYAGYAAATSRLIPGVW